MVLQLILKRDHKNYKEFVDGNCTVKEEEGKEVILVEAQHLYEYNKLTKQLTSGNISMKIVPRSLLVALVSQFDSFLGKILRVLFYLRPELLNGSDKSLTFSQLVEFNSVESAKEYIVEKEIETVLRKSHSEQFDWLENKFNVPLRKNLPAWQVFIELTERRNLFVHANGIVSSQYIKVCKDHKVNLQDDIKVGKELHVNPRYFKQAYECIYEIGVKLAQVLWRKQQSDDIREADRNLNEVVYQLLHDEKNSLAVKLLDFATETLKKHHDDTQRRMFVINRAQAYKWFGQAKRSLEIINQEDWSATSYEFKLAEAVLRDDFKQAAYLMGKIDSDSFLDKSGYREWPLFKEFRKTQEFLQAYETIYKEKYDVVTEEVPEEVGELQEEETYNELGLTG